MQELPDLRPLFVTLLAVLGASLFLALALIVYLLWRVRRIHLPPDADPLTALRATPLLVVIVLDLLDLSLDFFSVPIAWVLLGRLGLGALRGVTVIEELIPGTQLLPTMTLAWLAVRLFKLGEAPVVVYPQGGTRRELPPNL